RAAAAGGGAAAVAEVARRLAARSVIYFCVENVEFLRRGGRIGTAQALLGSALAVKPLLTVAEGQIRAYERVRTMTKAMARLEDLAVTALGAAAGMGSGVDVAVLHLDNRSEADRLAASLIGRVPGTSSVTVTELSAVLGVHTGPGTVGVVVARRD
ncbi:MAG: DegV family protein, partial [Microlunatus sp.]|nr:DegV family protein [Microlunatus sp.]